MTQSILTSIKKLLGITEESTDFDTDIIIFINSVFPILLQLGVGPEEGFKIEDSKTTWLDYLGEKDLLKYAPVKTFIYLKVKLVFDPPLSSFIAESYNRTLSELEWRLNVMADPIDVKEVTNE